MLIALLLACAPSEITASGPMIAHSIEGTCGSVDGISVVGDFSSMTIVNVEEYSADLLVVGWHPVADARTDTTIDARCSTPMPTRIRVTWVTTGLDVDSDR